MKKDQTWDVLSTVLFPGGTLAKKAWDEYNKSESEKLSKSSSSKEMQIIAEKQRLSIEIMEKRARAAQELALAQRLIIAEEVEIEEYYDGSGEGSLGLDAKADAKTDPLVQHLVSEDKDVWYENASSD